MLDFRKVHLRKLLTRVPPVTCAAPMQSVSYQQSSHMERGMQETVVSVGRLAEESDLSADDLGDEQARPKDTIHMVRTSLMTTPLPNG